MINAKWGYTLPKKWDNVLCIKPFIPNYYKVTILHSEGIYSAIVTNTAWIDKFKSKEYGWKKVGCYLYDYVKQQNNLI